MRVVPEAPPHDLNLEREVLGSCLTYPEILDTSEVIPADFYSSANGEVFGVLCAMRKCGETIDTVNLRTRLHDSGALKRLGGDDYLMGLTDGIPTRTVPTQQLRKLARVRRVTECAQALSLAARANEDCRALFDALERARRDLESITAHRELPSLADFVEGLTFDPRRMHTRLPALDACLRGGLPPGKLVVLVGAPGSCKTSLAAWLLSECELQGACAMYVASDENRTGIVIRLGQQHGLEREALESPMPAARRRFAKDLRDHRPNLHIIDPLRDRLTLEEAERKLAASAEAQGKIAVLIVDSLQTVHSAAAAGEDSPHARLNAVINSCRAIADRGTIVIAISEMNRGGYRSTSGAQESSALASGAGSSRIEYGADLQMSLTAVAHENGVVDVSVNKNRIGSDKPTFRIKIDFARATFAETSPPPEPERTQPAAAKLGAARARVRDCLLKHRGLRSQRDVLAHSEGSRSANADAYRDMVRTGLIQTVDGVLVLNGDTSCE